MKRSSRYIHGMNKTPTHNTWYGMKQRCLYKKDKDYLSYGGRGIKVCKRWLTFKNFLEDMGIKPIGLTLDRINNDGNYEPSNCKWATRKEQQRNRRIKAWVYNYNGITQSLKQWAKIVKIKESILRNRFYLGWPTERIFNEVVRTRKSNRNKELIKYQK